MSSAFLEVQAIIEPAVRHVVTEQRRETNEREESGDPPPQKAPVGLDPRMAREGESRIRRP